MARFRSFNATRRWDQLQLARGGLKKTIKEIGHQADLKK